MLTEEVIKYINQSVLCWLATASKDLIPNVSPKEIFTNYKSNNIVIANIASPQSVKNIRENPNVCVSFVDVYVQKGFQLKGTATIVKKGETDFEILSQPLIKMATEKFPFRSLTNIRVESIKPILAPSYLLYPDNTTEAEQIASAKAYYEKVSGK